MRDSLERTLSDIGVAGLTLSFGVTFPIAVVTSIFIYGRFRDNPTIKRRQLSLLTPTHVVGALCAFILQPWFLAVKAWPDDIPESLHISRILSYLIKVWLLLGMFLLLLARFWVCYIENSKATERQMWRKQLNPDRKSFVLDNYTTLGDTKLLFRLGFAVWLFFSLIQLFAALFLDFKMNVFVSFGGFTPLMLCAAVILYKLFFYPSDLFFIRNEFVAVSVGLSLVFAPMLIFTIFTIEQNNERLLAILWDLNIIVAMLLYFAVTSATPLCAIAIQHYAIQSRDLSDGPEDVLTVLQRERLFDAFSLHLTREFCIENLLFVVELIHFREYLVLSDKLDASDLPKESVLSDARVSKSVELSPILLPYYEQGNFHSRASKPESVRKKLISVSQSMKFLMSVPEASPSPRPNPDPVSPVVSETRTSIANEMHAALSRPSSMSDPVVPLKSMRRSTVKIDPERAVEDIVCAIWSKYIGPKSQLMVNISGPVYHDIQASHRRILETGRVSDVAALWSQLDRAGNETLKLLVESYSRFNFADIIDRMSDEE